VEWEKPLSTFYLNTLKNDGGGHEGTKKNQSFEGSLEEEKC